MVLAPASDASEVWPSEHVPSALLVTADPLVANRWAATLEEAGYYPTRCDGRHLTERCPRFAGLPCPLRDRVDVAVVDLRVLGGLEPTAENLARSCTRVPDDGMTVFVHAAPGATPGSG